MMYRIVAIIGGALALAACSTTPEWMSLDGLKPGPMTDTVRFESEPPGAEAKTSNGQTCRTPCSVALPVEAPLTVTFSLSGYQPESETIEPIAQTGSSPQMRPNPVMVELTPAPPQAKPARKPAAKRPAAKKSAAKRAARPAAQQSTAPAAAPPAQQQPAPAAAAPWPAPPKQ